MPRRRRRPSRPPASRSRCAEPAVHRDDHYGPSSGDEYAMVKSQLEEDGLFTVDLKSTEWVQYSKDRTADVYPAYQLGWFPDYSDADNYLTPFFLTKNFLGNHFSDQQIEDLILQQAVETDPAARTQEIEDIQDARRRGPVSTVPLPAGRAGGGRRHRTSTAPSSTRRSSSASHR